MTAKRIEECSNIAEANRELARRFRLEAATIRQQDKAAGAIAQNPDGSSVAEYLDAKAARLEAMQAALDARMLGEREL